MRSDSITPLSRFCMEKMHGHRSKLAKWYANNCTEYGNLWDPTMQDGARTEMLDLRMIALPLWAAKLHHNFNGAVMPHELLAALKTPTGKPGHSPRQRG